MDQQAPTTGPGASTAEPAAGGPSSPAEWALFCDYTAATDQPTLPTTVGALPGFLVAVPAAPATVARRVRAIAAAHRRAGYLLERPVAWPDLRVALPYALAGPDQQHQGHLGPVIGGAGADAGFAPGRLLAGCPTRGWTEGLWGRRDAFLVVLTSHLRLTLSAVRAATSADIDFDTSESQDPSVVIAGSVVPITDDARTCAACAVVRWLEVLGDLDGLGRGSARKTLTDAHAARAQPHVHATGEPARWRGAAQLLPAIDQHGGHDDYRPMTTRALRSRLALARARAQHGDPKAPQARSDTEPTRARSAAQPPRGAHDLAAVLGVLDAIADDADALNARIQSLLDEHR